MGRNEEIFTAIALRKPEKMHPNKFPFQRSLDFLGMPESMKETTLGWRPRAELLGDPSLPCRVCVWCLCTCTHEGERGWGTRGSLTFLLESLHLQGSLSSKHSLPQGNHRKNKRGSAGCVTKSNQQHAGRSQMIPCVHLHTYLKLSLSCLESTWAALEPPCLKPLANAAQAIFICMDVFIHFQVHFVLM